MTEDISYIRTFESATTNLLKTLLHCTQGRPGVSLLSWTDRLATRRVLSTGSRHIFDVHSSENVYGRWRQELSAPPSVPVLWLFNGETICATFGYDAAFWSCSCRCRRSGQLESAHGAANTRSDSIDVAWLPSRRIFGILLVTAAAEQMSSWAVAQEQMIIGQHRRACETAYRLCRGFWARITTRRIAAAHMYIGFQSLFRSVCVDVYGFSPGSKSAKHS
jgi:hypothetical protein